MNRLVRSLVLAAATLALAPAAARADRPSRHAPPAAMAPPVAPPRVIAARAELAREYRRLDRARERFYAGWNGSRREQRRFERWYAERREALDRENARLSAWARWEPREQRRGHGHDCD